MLTRVMSTLRARLLGISLLSLSLTPLISTQSLAYGHMPMAGSGAYGAFQGCHYGYAESEAIQDINDEIDELQKERKELRRARNSKKRELRELQGRNRNRQGGAKGDALKELKLHLKDPVISQIRDYAQDTNLASCNYKDSCTGDVKPACLSTADNSEDDGVYSSDFTENVDEIFCQNEDDLWHRSLRNGDEFVKICSNRGPYKALAKKSEDFDSGFCTSALNDYIEATRQADITAKELKQLERELKAIDKTIKLARNERSDLREEEKYEAEEDTEAGCPNGNCGGYRVARPKVSKGRVVGGVLAALAGAYLGYRVENHRSKTNARLGYHTTPYLGLASTLGAAQGIYGAVAGGMGAGGYGCVGHMGAGGFYGSGGLMGNGLYSPHMGGAFGYPGGMIGPYAGGGMYMPGMGPWGVAGPGGAHPFGYPGMMIGLGGAIGVGGGGFAPIGFPVGGGFALAGGGIGAIGLGGIAPIGFPVGGGFALAGGGIGAIGVGGGGFAPIGFPVGGGFALAGGGIGAIGLGGIAPIGFPVGGGFALAGGGIGAIGAAYGGIAPIGFPLAGGGIGAVGAYGALAGGLYGGIYGGIAGGALAGGALGTGHLEAQQRMLAQYQAQIQAQSERQAVISRLYGELQKIQMQIMEISGGGGGYAGGIYPTPLPAGGDPNLGRPKSSGPRPRGN